MISRAIAHSLLLLLCAAVPTVGVPIAGLGIVVGLICADASPNLTCQPGTYAHPPPKVREEGSGGFHMARVREEVRLRHPRPVLPSFALPYLIASGPI